MSGATNSALDRAIILRADDPPIIQRDDGLFQIGWDDDAAGPFASRRHAKSVAAKAAA